MDLSKIIAWVGLGGHSGKIRMMPEAVEREGYGPVLEGDMDAAYKAGCSVFIIYHPWGCTRAGDGVTALMEFDARHEAENAKGLHPEICAEGFIERFGRWKASKRSPVEFWSYI